MKKKKKKKIMKKIKKNSEYLMFKYLKIIYIIKMGCIFKKENTHVSKN